MFGNIKTEKRKFHHQILLEDLDIDNKVISRMVSPGEPNYKYFIGYKDDDYKIKLLRIMYPKINGNVECYGGETS